MGKFIIGTRGSTLALTQAEIIRKQLKDLYPRHDFQLKQIQTRGDKTGRPRKRHAEEIGFFVKEIEEALLSKKIDIAVHSLKDLPIKNPKQLQIAAIPSRESPQDGLVTKDGRPLSELVPGSRIGTGSVRRKSQLLRFNSTFNVVEIQGNVDTRLRKLREGTIDALVLAVAGLHRMGVNPSLIWPIPYETMLPAPGQGALAVETRRDEKEAEEIVSRLDDPVTRRCVTAERAFLSYLGGGCQLPLGALGVPKEQEILLEAVLMSEDGKRQIRSSLHSKEDPARLGGRLGEKFFEMGAEELLNHRGNLSSGKG